MLRIKQQLLPQGHPNRPGNAMRPQGLLFHTTNNWRDNTGDEMHARYMASTDRVVSWHVTVDRDSATQHLPFDEHGWHAGDGTNGRYNRNWIGMEIACEAVEPGQPLDRDTYQNAVDVAAQILMRYGWDTADRLQPHAVVAGKDCPHHTLFDRDQFKRDVLTLIASRREEAQQMEELLQRVSELERRVQALEQSRSMPVPSWAREAVEAAVRAGYIDTPSGGSMDFYRLVTVMYRAGAFENSNLDAG